MIYTFTETNREITVTPIAADPAYCSGCPVQAGRKADVEQITRDTTTGQTWINAFCRACNTSVLVRHEKLAKDAARRARKAARDPAAPPRSRS